MKEPEESSMIPVLVNFSKVEPRNREEKQFSVMPRTGEFVTVHHPGTTDLEWFRVVAVVHCPEEGARIPLEIQVQPYDPSVPDSEDGPHAV
jgi:hypothetical protein